MVEPVIRQDMQEEKFIWEERWKDGSSQEHPKISRHLKTGLVKVEKVAENLQSEPALERTKDKGPVKRALS